jgi:hypothetical protein
VAIDVAIIRIVAPGAAIAVAMVGEVNGRRAGPDAT